MERDDTITNILIDIGKELKIKDTLELSRRSGVRHAAIIKMLDGELANRRFNTQRLETLVLKEVGNEKAQRLSERLQAVRKAYTNRRHQSTGQAD